ncbi:endo alpha-1,4 polygalactosaminidase [Anaerolineales bacterium HSG6]|nr:endo alpha-1,4 polygalactosaminidase [Anaerolineales bacterium HSG6]MDM8531214.1 endo alpha-1,4 polygalactosaminidase [Anaerolineales bacterium HSG25]
MNKIYSYPYDQSYYPAIPTDNMDSYQNNTGFPLTADDQLAYNKWLAEAAHERGLSIGLKNNSDQVADLLPYFDWALTEDCFADEFGSWCTDMSPFIEAGKPVFAAEYTDSTTETEFKNQFCPQAEQLGISVILKDRNLDAWRRDCS